MELENHPFELEKLVAHIPGVPNVAVVNFDIVAIGKGGWKTIR